jgi:hypothetical protein
MILKIKIISLLESDNYQMSHFTHVSLLILAISLFIVVLLFPASVHLVQRPVILLIKLLPFKKKSLFTVLT